MSAATERPPDALRRQVGSAMRWNALLPLRIVLGSLASLVLFNANQNFPFGGTSILIIVGVGLETVKQIQAQLQQRNYEGFLR